MAGIVVALQDSVVRGMGRTPVVIRKGEAWASDSAVVREHPSLFSRDSVDARGGVSPVDRPVERHTKAPGERSTAKRA